LLNGALIGFVIGISTFRIHWILHGILIGFIMGIPFALGFLVVILWTIGLLEYLGLIGSEGISIGKLIAIPNGGIVWVLNRIFYILCFQSRGKKVNLAWSESIIRKASALFFLIRKIS